MTRSPKTECAPCHIFCDIFSNSELPLVPRAPLFPALGVNKVLMGRGHPSGPQASAQQSAAERPMESIWCCHPGPPGVQEPRAAACQERHPRGSYLSGLYLLSEGHAGFAGWQKWQGCFFQACDSLFLYVSSRCSEFPLPKYLGFPTK